MRTAYLDAAKLPYPEERRRELALAAAELAPDVEKASILETLFDAAPDDDHVAERFDEVLRRLGRRESLRAMWTRRVASAPDQDVAVAHRRELAELALEDGDQEAALATLRTNVEATADAESFSRLVEVLSSSQRTTDLCAALEEHAARLAKRGESWHQWGALRFVDAEYAGQGLPLVELYEDALEHKDCGVRRIAAKRLVDFRTADVMPALEKLKALPREKGDGDCGQAAADTALKQLAKE